MKVKQRSNQRPTLKILSNELIERIIEEAEEVLEKVGVCVLDDEGLQLLGNGGARIDREKEIAFIPKKLVEDSLKTVPSSIKIYDRNGNHKLTLGGDNVHFQPNAGAIKVWDYESGRLRDAVTQDVIDFTRVTDAMDNIHLLSTNYYPSDIPPEFSTYFRLFIVLKYASKPCWTSMFEIPENVRVAEELIAALCGSEKAIREKPMLVFNAMPASPLRWSAESCQYMIQVAKTGAPLTILDCPLIGATAPITLAGVLTQVLAEILSGVVITQLVNPGTPVLMGGFTEVFDMNFGTSLGGPIECQMGSVACVEVTKYLNIPAWVDSGFNDAKRPDAQAGLETAIGYVLGALAGANLIEGAGDLGAAAIASNEKLVIDNEICGKAYRLINGITSRGERLAEDLFTEGLFDGKHFLLSPNTMKWFKEEIWYPGKVISRESSDSWMAKGNKTAEQRANEEVKRILATHEPEPLDKDVDKELTNIMLSYARKYGMDKLPLP